MTALETLSNCQFCSVVSKTNGEDPIGTAGNHEHWLILEAALPWSEKLMEEPAIKPLITLMKGLILEQQVKLRPIIIAPDREYSRAGYNRVLYYHQPTRLFTQFEKQEYWVPEADTTRLATALLQKIAGHPNELEAFQSYQIDSRHIRELLVCTHGNVDVACSRFGFPIYKTLRDKYALESEGHLRVWRCSHFGGHQFAPTLIDLPQGQYWGHLEPDRLDLLVYRSGELSKLRSCYRGWSGLEKFAQMVEREIWIREGWDWLDYRKAGQILTSDPGGASRYFYKLLKQIPSKRLQFLINQRSHKPNWAEIRIEFSSPDGTDAGAYEARVEVCGEVISALQSGGHAHVSRRQRLKLQPVKQYRISQLRRCDG
ncbi:sucrase ferredoxin [Myxacorys almedinensis]|uniref:Sucrase ferredoxin n=1 Tax=Myxacorys almedinensis A TaxID=2690445 RepID=A0A8J7ZAU3_9CYAN|nr:sucrase ferredoxin [Myxacorys almedinensis]NDJ18585.1 sucrase ferredoxin [Myxacorys almedinensis A]